MAFPDERHVEADEPVADLDQRRDGGLEADELPLEVVNALGRLLREGAAKDLLLEALETRAAPAARGRARRSVGGRIRVLRTN